MINKKEEEIDWEKLGLMSDEKLDEVYESIKKEEEQAKKDVIKYFDRIHNKLFTFNNILIAGFYALSKMENEIPVKMIIIPIMNFILLILVEYRMMESQRKRITLINKTPEEIEEIEKINKEVNSINLLSLFTIFTTLIVLIVFLVYLLKS